MAFTLLSTKQIKHAGQSLFTLLEEALSLTSTYSVTHDFPAIAVGSYVQSTFTVPGAAVGKVAIPSFSLPIGKAVLTAQVTATNTVVVTLQNLDSSTLNLSSGTLTIKLL